jgi:hypothetical protein
MNLRQNRRDTGNIGHTRNRTKTIKKNNKPETKQKGHWQYWAHTTQDEDNKKTINLRQKRRNTGNIGHTRHRTKSIKNNKP